MFFSLDKYCFKIWAENSVSAIQHIENKKNKTFYLSASSHHARTNLFAYSCVFIFHTLSKNGMIGHGRGEGGGGLEGCQNAQKQFIIKLIRNLFCTNL